MFGPRYARLFKSRWAALLWAAGILFTAWSFASEQPGADGDANAQSTSDTQVAALVNAF